MGDKRKEARAKALADKALAPRKDALVALAIAADAARAGDAVRASAEQAAQKVLAQARKRAEAIIAEAQKRVSEIREGVKVEMANREERWRTAYGTAKEVGWTPAELRKAEQPPPPRVAGRRRAAPEHESDAGSRSPSSMNEAARGRDHAGGSEKSLPRSA